MTWKKNGFSYLIWFVYTLVTGTALVSLGSALCAEAGIAAWWGIGGAVLYLGIAGGVVFFLHKTSAGCLAFAEKNRTLLFAAESVLLVLLLAAGLALRVYRIGGAEEDSAYFAMAEVVAGQKIPQMVHGASYFYVQLLHGVLRLLGNQYLAGIGLQVALQLLACAVLYFVVRKIAGRVAALVSFGFCMLAPYMLENALVFSPDMLYFLFFVLAALFVIVISAGKIRLPAYFAVGVLAAFCCYVDMIGLLLFLLGISFAFAEKEEAPLGKRFAAAGICGLGLAAGFLFFIGADSFLSGKSFVRVWEAWFELYRAEAFRMPVTVGTAGSVAEGLLLAGMMAFGIFAFWRERKRDRILPYVTAACVVMAGCGYGVFTEEMPGFLALYLLFAILAGVSLEQSFCAAGMPETVAGAVSEKSVPAAARSRNPGREMSMERILEQEAKLWEVGFAAEAGEQAFFENDLPQQGQDPDMPLEEPAEEVLSQAVSDERQEALSQEEAGRESGPEAERRSAEAKKIKYLDNPLPLPKKHVKRVLDYSVQVSEEDDFDYPVVEEDDFDI